MRAAPETIVRGEVFEKQRVEMDNKMFIDCRFRECVLIFAGEAECMWINTPCEACTILYVGRAFMMVELLRSLGWQPPQPIRPSSDAISALPPLNPARGSA